MVRDARAATSANLTTGEVLRGLIWTISCFDGDAQGSPFADIRHPRSEMASDIQRYLEGKARHRAPRHDVDIAPSSSSADIGCRWRAGASDGFLLILAFRDDNLSAILAHSGGALTEPAEAETRDGRARTGSCRRGFNLLGQSVQVVRSGRKPRQSSHHGSRTPGLRRRNVCRRGCEDQPATKSWRCCRRSGKCTTAWANTRRRCRYCPRP